ERQVETGHARIALAAGAPAQLVIDAARLVAFGTDDMQAASGNDLFVAAAPRFAQGLDLLRRGILQLGNFDLDTAAKHDVGTAAGHVGGNGDDAGAPRLRDDFRLLLVILGV